MQATASNYDLSGAMGSSTREVRGKMGYVTLVDIESDSRVLLLQWLYDDECVQRGWVYEEDEDEDDLDDAALDRFRAERTRARVELEGHLRDRGENPALVLSEASRGLRLAFDEGVGEQDFFLQDIE